MSEVGNAFIMINLHTHDTEIAVEVAGGVELSSIRQFDLK